MRLKLDNMVFVTVLSISICFLQNVEAARILGIFPIPSVSHQVVHRQIMLELNKRGHEIVIVTTDPIPNPPPNYTQIDIGPKSYEYFRATFDFAAMVGSERPTPVALIDGFIDFFSFLSEVQLGEPAIQGLINSDQKFDLMFLEWLVTPVFLGFAHRYQVPVIGTTSLALLATGYDNTGSPAHPISHPDLMVGSYENLSFMERIRSVYYTAFLRHKWHFEHLPRQDAIMRRTFGDVGIPYVGELENNVSLLLVNSHHTTSIVRPITPNIIEIGGTPLHLPKKKPLPKDLQEFLDSATDGVIYFSLGSNVKSSTMPESKRALFLDAFRQIKQKVLWKWETDDLPGKPDNVKVHKWLPQTDVLAHPNVKAFISQGGLQSMGESTHFTVPMVVIPFFADQELNAKKLESVGVAIRLDFEVMTTEDVLFAIKEVATNPKYKESMVKYSALTRDQPQTPMERAVWWTEYVLRHNGARHLRSSAVDMPWYQYFLLDVIGFLLAILCSTLFALHFICSRLYRAFFKNKTKKE